MKYLGYVEAGSDTHASSVVLPDFPGCFSAADDDQNLNASVQEAVELHFEGEDFKLPTPLTLNQVQDLSEFNYLGVWMWFDIDTNKISTKLQRINITMPENILSKLDAIASEQHISRSGMVRQLVERV